jgi:hypothetical protein
MASYIQKAKSVSVSAGDRIRRTTIVNKKYDAHVDSGSNSSTDSSTLVSAEMNDSCEKVAEEEKSNSSNMINFKGISNNLASFAKTAAEGTRKAAQRTAEGTRVAAQKAAEGTKTAMSATVDATKNAAERLEMWKISAMDSSTDSSKGLDSPAPRGSAVIQLEEVANPAMFGIPLEQTLLDQNGVVIADIPLVVRETIHSILDYDGYMEEGIFRLSTNVNSLNLSKRKYNLREPVDFSESLDTHLPACVLKLFLRELPETIFTSQLLGYFNAVTGLPPAEKLPRLIYLTQQLPKLNSRVIQEILALLRLVVKYQDVNKMTISNLGIIFLPCFGLASAEVFELLLNHQDKIWQGATVVSQHPKNPLNNGSRNLPQIPQTPPPPIYIPPPAVYDMNSPSPGSRTSETNKPIPPPRNTSLSRSAKNDIRVKPLPKSPVSQPATRKLPQTPPG